MKVKDILDKKGTEIYSVKPEESVLEAISKMAELKIGALLVMKNDSLVGIISERDYRNKIILKGRTSKDTPVSQIMIDKVICVEPTDNINLCMQLMTNKKIRHLPVLDNKSVVGVISIGDVVKAVIESQKSEIDTLRNYIATGGGYPA
ncbi:CBS domain-containing protein [Rhodohalobacter sp. 8-1]|uniref:CBS domain-containing protein n=1 Tax=Rhodohalobacter sp. 8-1 TaxID=3131972 RepID=UPI0030EBE05B